MKRQNIIGLCLAALVIACSVLWLARGRNQTSTDSKANTNQAGTPAPIPSPNPPAAFNKGMFSISEADSPWVIINKQRKLADGYTPTDLEVPAVALRLSQDSNEMKLRTDAARALEKMFAAAHEQGIELKIASAFRSQDYQVSLYGSYVAKDGQAAADRYSARPGHSEHQTGWALDVEPASRECEVEQCFADLPEGKWVAEHAAEFGYIIRYGKDKEDLTGYIYEPWHIRFVGTALAPELVKTGETMEQFFGLNPALDYVE